ncbi:MAG: hypothetical protein JXR95_06620 [Deltaproteobacteria bacterium]|nr:hypothetical protein [Deltaproteobacteria bacterium]
MVSINTVKKISLYSFTISTVFILYTGCSEKKSRNKQTTAVHLTKSPPIKNCSYFSIKPFLTQGIGGTINEELSAYSECPNYVFKDENGRVFKTDKDGKLIIPDKISIELLTPVQVETYSIDAAIASRLYNMQYHEESFKRFISLMDLEISGNNQITFKNYFCRLWKKLVEKGADWRKLTALAGVSVFKKNKIWKMINHYHNYSIYWPFSIKERTKILVKNHSSASVSVIKAIKIPLNAIILSIRGNELPFSQFFKKCKIVGEKNSYRCTQNGKDFFVFLKVVPGVKLYFIVENNKEWIDIIRKISSVITLVASSPPCSK